MGEGEDEIDIARRGLELRIREISPLDLRRVPLRQRPCRARRDTRERERERGKERERERGLPSLSIPRIGRRLRLNGITLHHFPRVHKHTRMEQRMRSIMCIKEALGTLTFSQVV